MAREFRGQFQQVVARTLAVGSRSVNHDDHAIDSEPAVRQHAGNQPAFQHDLIFTARKGDIGEAQRLAGWSLDDGLGRLIDKLFGDVARDPDVAKAQQTRKDQQCRDGTPPRHVDGTRPVPIRSRGCQPG